MIVPANAPNASRHAGRPLAPDRQDSTTVQPAARAGHRWPFLSRQTLRPAAQEHAKNPRSGS